MNVSDPVDQAEIAKSKAIAHDIVDEKHNLAVSEKQDLSIEAAPQSFIGDDDDLKTIPTDEELATLRRVSGKLPWQTFTVAFVELCERFSYYGTTAVCKRDPMKTSIKVETNKSSRQLHSATVTTRLHLRRSHD
jgi:POT family proton-dependent oligopeptide transporter